MRLILLLVAALAFLVGCGPPAPVPVPSFDTPPTETVAPPARILIPAIAVSKELVPLGLNPDGTLAVPPVETPEIPSWFDRGPKPGERGPAVIAGHVNGGGRPGVFAHLHELAPGDLVYIDTANGRQVAFEVTKVETYPKDSFPTAAVYGDTPEAALRLITCGGTFDRAAESYRSNVVAYARAIQ